MKLRIYDVDGTLVYIPETSINELFVDILKELDYNEPIDQSLFTKFWFGTDENALPNELGMNVESFWDIFRKYDTAEFRSTSSAPYSDIQSLRSFRSNGGLIALNSDAPDSIVLAQTDMIKDVYHYMLTNHNGIKRKPSPAGINTILQYLDIEPNDACYIGNTIKDIMAARRAGILSVHIERDLNPDVTTVCPDYRIFRLSELDDIMSEVEQIMFAEIDVINNPKYDELTSDERLVLQNHFRRIQQHSILAGKFMELQAEKLGQNQQLWRKVGLLHDVDYAHVYFEMENHGFASRNILEKYNLDERIIYVVENHNTLQFENSSDLLERAVFISGRFLKQMVHTMRHYQIKNPSKITFEQFESVYRNDPRRNETLTHLDPVPEKFGDFYAWMKQHSDSITGYAIEKGELFDLAKQAFVDTKIIPLPNTPNAREVKILYGN